MFQSRMAEPTALRSFFEGFGNSCLALSGLGCEYSCQYICDAVSFPLSPHHHPALRHTGSSLGAHVSMPGALSGYLFETGAMRGSGGRGKQVLRPHVSDPSLGSSSSSLLKQSVTTRFVSSCSRQQSKHHHPFTIHHVLPAAQPTFEISASISKSARACTPANRRGSDVRRRKR
jgi:hypothetical protein